MTMPPDPTTEPRKLPMPDWSRPGETWRPEPETDWRPAEPDTPCDAKQCERRAIAVRRDNGYTNCGRHLREGGMWVEDGRLVSWTLRP